MKIPFERTIAGAYRFAFTNILSIVGIGWFPFLLAGAAIAGVIYLMLPQLIDLSSLFARASDTKSFDNARFLALLPQLLGSYLVVIVVYVFAQAMVSVGVLRKALGQHPGPVFIFFSLGSQVWRLIGSYLLVMLLAWGAMALIGGSIAAISFGLSKVSQGAQVAGTTILIILAYLWFLYALVRLVFFIPAVVVAENHIGIRRAWHLGKGNFWRIVGIYLVVTLPLGMAVNTVASSLLQMAMGSGGLVMTNPADAQKLFLALFHALGRIWPYYLVLQFIAMMLQAGLLSGAIANAYSLVTGGGEIAPPPSKVPA